MGTYDISRVAFDPKKHYTSVRMQQGRVLTDDDWNENERIENEDRRRSRIDIIGPYGSPDDGYKILGPVVVAGPGKPFDFTIGAGILYLGGLRLHHAKETYLLQNDWLEQPASEQAAPTLAELNKLINNSRSDLVYLEVWQQPVCAVEDGELFEKALGGPDTTTRVRNMARVHIYKGIGNDSCSDAFAQLKNILSGANLGTINEKYERVPDTRMVVSFPGKGLPNDLCSPQVTGGYLGAENQAIRVQLRKNKTFTWGFDDASPLYRITAVTAVIKGVMTTTVTLVTPIKDPYHWPLSGQVVEILPWSTLLSDGEKTAAIEGHISQVNVTYDPNLQTFTLATSLPANFGTAWSTRVGGDVVKAPKDPVYFYMKVWNRGTDITSLPEISVTSAKPIPLGNTGLAIDFTGNDYIPGDYWVIGARPDTPDQVVPWSLQLGTGISPMGIHRFFAPLGILDWTVSAGAVVGTIVSDCRKKFKPLTELECCCTFTVGDGTTSFGDFNSIDDALSALPGEGGKICILPGIHQTNSVITGKKNIEICGCGGEGLIIPTPKGIADPVFQFISCHGIKLCNLFIASQTGTAISISDDPNSSQTSGITIVNNHIVAGVCAIFINVGGGAGNNNLRIIGNKIGMVDNAGGFPAIFTIADDVLIEHNRIVVVPAPDVNNPGDTRDPNGPGPNPYNKCDNTLVNYKNLNQWHIVLKGISGYVTQFVAGEAPSAAYLAQGGIQIGSTSERVRVIQNVIIGGAGNGITLGHFFVDDKDVITSSSPYFEINDYSVYKKDFLENTFNGSLYDIDIIENEITQMGLSGIGIAGTFDLDKVGLIYNVEDLDIFRNRIYQCALQIKDLIALSLKLNMEGTIGFGGIALGSCVRTIIRENWIEDNGVSYELPVCGIFISFAEEIEISNNRIQNNGVKVSQNLQTGSRGGIIIKFAFQPLNIKNAKGSKAPGFDGAPAALINENIVDSPLGNALFMIALGPVSVLGNQFTTRGQNPHNSYSRLGGAIFILNLGIAKDLLIYLIMIQGAWLAYTKSTPSSPAESQGVIDGFLEELIIYEFFPDGRTMFANNQVTLDSRNQTNAAYFGAQVIATLDDISYHNNQSECVGFTIISSNIKDYTLLNTILLGVTVRSNDNRFTDGFLLPLFSLLSLALYNSAAHNQATHCLIPLGFKVIPANIAANNIVLTDPNGKDCDAILSAL